MDIESITTLTSRLHTLEQTFYPPPPLSLSFVICLPWKLQDGSENEVLTMNSIMRDLEIVWENCTSNKRMCLQKQESAHTTGHALVAQCAQWQQWQRMSLTFPICFILGWAYVHKAERVNTSLSTGSILCTLHVAIETDKTPILDS